MTRSRTLPTLPTIAVFVASAIALSIAVGFLMRPQTLAQTRPLSVSQMGRRVLIIAPHPDDEVLTSGGTIHQLVARGAKVRVVIVTAGDGYYRAARRLSPGPVDAASFHHLGDVRHAESLTAAADLGLPARDVISLGFPDGGTSALWNVNWDPTDPRANRSGVESVPYRWALAVGTPFCGRDLATDLTTIIREFHPDTIIAPDVHETHPDHVAVAAFSMFAMDEAGFTGRRLTGVVHFKGFPYPWAYLPQASLAPPTSLTGDGSTWYAVPMTSADEVAKHTAIDAYHSQTAIADLGVYMRAFVRRNELFNERMPAVLATATTDAVPQAGAAGTVVVTPRPVIAFPLNANRIGSLRAVAGPSTLWIGIVSDTTVSREKDYRVELRLLGGSTTGMRLDVLVHGGQALAQRVSSTSLMPTGIKVEAAGRTLWVGVPVDVLAGRQHMLAAATAGPPRSAPFRTPWRDVAL